MAYNPDEPLSKSLFNEAGFVIRRLDILQSRINSVRLNPLMWNQEIGDYNYKIWFADLCSLLNEVWAKLTDDEKKDIEAWRGLIQQAIKITPPHKVVIRGGNYKDVRVSLDNWERLEKGLTTFEKYIKTFLDAHGLSNPDIEGDSMF